MLANLGVLAGAMVSNLLILVGLTYLVSIAVARVPQARTAYHGAIFGLMLGVIAALRDIQFHPGGRRSPARSQICRDTRLGSHWGTDRCGCDHGDRDSFAPGSRRGCVPQPYPGPVMIATGVLGVGARMLGARSSLRVLLCSVAGLRSCGDWRRSFPIRSATAILLPPSSWR